MIKTRLVVLSLGGGAFLLEFGNLLANGIEGRGFLELTALAIFILMFAILLLLDDYIYERQ